MSTPPRRFKLVEDPEGPLTEPYLGDLRHRFGLNDVLLDALPAPEPQYPGWRKSPIFERFRDEMACVDDAATEECLNDLYDRGLLVVERDEWERLTAERGLWVSREDHEAALDAAAEPAPSYSDEEIERLAKVAREALNPVGITPWPDVRADHKDQWCSAARAVLDNARPDPTKWVARRWFEWVIRGRDEALARIATLESDRDEALARIAELEDQRDEARTDLAHLEGAWRIKATKPAPDLRPTEEQVLRALEGHWTGPAGVLRVLRDHDWLHDTEAPPRLTPEEQAVLDAAEKAAAEWPWHPIADAVRAYQATLGGEG